MRSPVCLGDAPPRLELHTVGVLLPPPGPAGDTQAAAQERGPSAPWWPSGVSASGGLLPPPTSLGLPRYSGDPAVRGHKSETVTGPRLGESQLQVLFCASLDKPLCPSVPSPVKWGKAAGRGLSDSACEDNRAPTVLSAGFKLAHPGLHS